MIIPYGEWLPDQSDLGKGVSVAKNCLPTTDGYTEAKSLTTYSDALTARCQGFYSIKHDNGIPYNFAGDATKLYRLDGASWTDISKAGGYSTSAKSRWWYEKYGNTIFATNGADNVQAYTLNSSAFDDLGGSPPTAKVMAVIDEWVLLGNVYDSLDGDKPNRLWWCAQNNPTNWTPSTETQCDYRTLQGSGGQIQRIIGGEYGTVFQENAITRLTRASAPVTFQVDELEQRGTDAPGSVVKLGRFVFYKARGDGFYVHNGESSDPIGNGKIDKTFLADLDGDYLDRISHATDYANKCIKFAYPGAGNTDGRPNKQIIFHWPTGKWSLVEEEIETYGEHLLTAYTLEDMNAFGPLESLTYALDDPFWKRGDLTLAAFNASHQLAQRTGAALTTTIETKRRLTHPGYKTSIREINSLSDGTSTFRVGKSSDLNTAPTYVAATQAPSGRFTVRAKAKYHSIEETITGGFTHAPGIDAEFRKEGRR